MNAPIFAFVATKGGVGKTTLAVQFAIARARAGLSVLLLDADRQASALAALALRGERQDLPQIAASGITDGRALRQQALLQAEKYDCVVIDAGGADSSALRAALIAATVAVVPFAPRQFDVWGVADVSALLREAQAQRDGLAVVAVLNRADPSKMREGKANVAARQAVADELGEVGDVLAHAVGNRVAVAKASAAGLSTLELPARERDRKADRDLAFFDVAVWALR